LEFLLTKILHLILVNQSKYKQVFMLDLTQGQDKRKTIGDNNVIKKTYADLSLGSQNILLNSNLLSGNSISNLPQQQTQQFSLVHQNSLQKPIILSTSTAGAGTLLQSSQASNAGNKIIVTPAPQIAGNVYVSTHGKLVIPSSNSQSIILDSKMISANNQLQSNQQKLQSTHQQRSKMENNLNMLRENSGGEKNIIYAKYTNSNNKNKLLQTVANIVPMQANKSGSVVQNQVKTISSSPQQQVGIKTIQRIQQQQIHRPQYGTSTVNFQNSPTSTTSSKIIHQPNNGNNLGSVNNNNDSTTTPR
jgi:hypothetical protein